MLNYVKLFSLNANEIAALLSERTLLGFYIYRNISSNFSDFYDFFESSFETFFLSNAEKRSLAKITFTLREYEKIIRSNDHLAPNEPCSNYKLIQTKNGSDNYILIEQIEGGKGIVKCNGTLKEEDFEKALFYFKISNETARTVSYHIVRLVKQINDWIDLTGKYFIADIRNIEKE